MERIWFFLYNSIVVPLLWLFYRIAGSFNRKIAAGIRGRKEESSRILELAAWRFSSVTFRFVIVEETIKELKLKSERENSAKFRIEFTKSLENNS